jgi:hypothetical protein
MLAQVSALAFRIAETVGRPPRAMPKNLPPKTLLSHTMSHKYVEARCLFTQGNLLQDQIE